MSLTWTDQGPPEADVVVLLHGWPGGVHTWRRLAPLLATRFRVLTPTLGGTDLPAQAAEVAEMVRELGIARFAAVGHAHGGGVAQLLALEGVGLDALILLDTIAFDRAPPVDLDPRAFVERGSIEIADLPSTDLDTYAALASHPPDPLDLTPYAGAMATWGFPIFLLWGEEDPYLPVSVAERLSDAMPGSTLGLVPDSGHFLLDDAFDPVGVMIVEYLRARFQGAPHGHEGVVMLQLERRPAWVDTGPFADDADDPAQTDEAQEVGPNA